MSSGEENTNLAVTPDWIDKVDIEELEQLAGVGYPPEKIALFFSVAVPDFLREYMNEKSMIRKHYERGMLINQAKEGMVALSAATNGNVTQAQRLDKIRRAINFEQAKKEIFYGE